MRLDLSARKLPLQCVRVATLSLTDQQLRISSDQRCDDSSHEVCLQATRDPSREQRVRLFGVDSEILDGLFHDGGLNLSVLQQLMERGQRDEARIHLEEVAQRLPAIAPSEAIGSKRRQTTRDPFADKIGQSL